MLIHYIYYFLIDTANNKEKSLISVHINFIIIGAHYERQMKIQIVYS